MQPYPNPNYFMQQFQPNYNPYLQRMENLQQFQQTIQPPVQTQPGIFARIVNDFNTLTANDVPMSGGAFFVKSDGTEIEQREWAANGQIVTKRFKAISDDLGTNPNILSSNEEKGQNTPLEAFLGALEEKVTMLNDKMDEILKQKPISKTKKEVQPDE